MNAMTSSSPEAARIPAHYDSDREAIQTALDTIPDNDPKRVRIVHIKNTLQLEEMFISEALLAEAEGNSAVSTVTGPGPMGFDDDGNIHHAF